MKIGFSSMVCPNWDLATMIARAAELGFDGVEVSLHDDASLSSQAARLAADPDAARKRFDAAGVRLLCIGASFPIESPYRDRVAANQRKIVDAIELAGKVGCPYVRVPFGPIEWLDTRSHVLSRVGEAFGDLIPHAVANGVTILLENGADLPDSRAVWFVLDAVSHPALQCCFDPCVAMGAGDPLTIWAPRLNRRIAMVRVCDAAFDERGAFQEYRLPGEGSLEWARILPLLRGLLFDGLLMFHWPKALESALPEPDEVLPKVIAYLRERISERQEPLSAYRKDKYVPNYGAAPQPGAVAT